MQFWNELEGRNIDGRHPLVRLIRSEGRSAWFESVAGDPAGSPATISLTEALTDADEVMDRLKAAQSLQHPNLVSISKVGQVTLDDTLFVYAVMAHIEQSLADVLQTQSLSPEEGREVAEALVAALTVIHQKGMSHGHVEAASVLATEEAVQLRSDCLQISPAGQADDVAGIGLTLFHAFTQRKELTATDAQINRIPAPFAEIVRNTFARRWTLAQVANALKPAPVAPPVPVVAPVVAPVVTPPAVVAPPSPPRPAETPVARLEPLPPQNESFPPEPEPVAAGAGRKPFGLYGGVAVVVLALLAWLFLKPHATPAPAPGPTPQAAAPAPPVAAPAAPAKRSAATPTHVGRPARTAPKTVEPKTPTPAATTAVGTGRSIWRVIAYTYRYEKPAQEMVEKLKAKHPNLNVAVFSPGTGKSNYLVSLGGAMTHEEALKMLDKARSMGLPPDSFVRNFSD